MSTTSLNTRRPRGVNPKEGKLQPPPRENGYKLPEYLEMAEINALIAAAPKPKAKLIMLEQWPVSRRPPGVRGPGPGSPGSTPGL